MIRDALRALFGHPRPMPINHPLRVSRELTTEANLRAATSDRIVRDAEKALRGEPVNPFVVTLRNSAEGDHHG